jgi:cellulose synthase/poly-beta-1,6-N-acetylglucosamine synthase-like glycosyltransferase
MGYTIIAYFFVRTLQQFIGILTSLRFLESGRKETLVEKSGGKIAVLIPLYREPEKIVREAIEFWQSSGEEVTFVSKSGDFSESHLINLPENISSISYSGSGGKAEQLNYAVDKIDADYYSIFDIDSRPELQIFSYIRSEWGDEVYQAPTLFTKGYSSASSLSKGNSLFQSRRVLSYEIPALLNGDFTYLVGHGLTVRKDILKKYPFPTETLTEDLVYGYRLGLKNIKATPVPYFDISEVPKNPIQNSLQTGRWFTGDLTFIAYVDWKLSDIGKLFFRYLHIFEWLLGSFAVLFVLIYGDFNQKIAIASVITLYLFLLHETANRFIGLKRGVSVYFGVVIKASINGVGPLYGVVRQTLHRLKIAPYRFEKVQRIAES